MRSGLRRVAIAGASLAGLRAAEALRAAGFDGDITLIGDEPHQPYDRPPLSKQVLAGTWEHDRTSLVVPGDTDTLDLSWMLGVAAVALDREDGQVLLADGRAVPCDGLVIATGASPRWLPGTRDIPGVHVVRTLEDSLRLRAELDAEPPRVAVVGAGFIGAEVAATCRQRGLAVTLIEPLPAPLGRALPAPIGEAIAALHRSHGVDVRLGTGARQVITDAAGHAAGVVLDDGSTVAAPVVVVGIGVSPNTEWLAGSGLALEDGVVCDESCLAAPGIVAAGDVARWFSRRYGASLRIEHWDHAADQAEYAAQRLLAWSTGDPMDPYDPVPWFWSDQYDRKIQFAGRATAGDEVLVVEGSLEEQRFVALFGRGGRVIGVLGMNRPAQVARWRNRILAGVAWGDALAEASPA